MPKTPEEQNRSYDVAGTEYVQAEDQDAVIKQIAEDNSRTTTSLGFVVKIHSNDLTVVCHTYEMGLGDAVVLRDRQNDAEKALNEFVKLLKAEYRKRTKHTLTITEKRDRRDCAVERVSLNDRYYLRCWRVYEITR